MLPRCAGLKFLVRLCTDLGLKDAQDYATKLKKAEKAKELRDQVSDGFTDSHRCRCMMVLLIPTDVGV